MKKGPKLVFINHHFRCPKKNCNTRTAYIRIKNKWTVVGEYHTECKQFSVLEDNHNEFETFNPYRDAKSELEFLTSEIEKGMKIFR